MTAAETKTATVPPLVVQRYGGLGDQLYMRPFVRRLCERVAEKGQDVYVPTAWLDHWWGFPRNLVLVADGMNLWLQVNALGKSDAARSYPTDQDGNLLRVVRLFPWMVNRWVAMGFQLIFHGSDDSMVQCIQASCGVEDWRPEDFRLALRPEWVEAARVMLAVLGVDPAETAFVQPPTIRTSWPSTSRTPDPGVWRRAVAVLRRRGYRVVAHGFLNDVHEKLADGIDASTWDLGTMDGRYPWTTIAAAMRLCAVNLAPPCWCLAVAQAVGARLFTVFGGMAQPSAYLDPRLPMDGIGWAAPDPFCHCGAMKHECAKAIPDVEEKLRQWLNALASCGDALDVRR